MSLYSVGTVTVTNGSQIVTGSGTSWNTAPYTIQNGATFSLTGSLVGYQVGAVGSDTQLTLASPYAGPTRAGVNYWIASDFTSSLNLPLMGMNNIDPATIYNRAMQLIDLASALNRWAVNETPSGTINGVNPTFTIANSPSVAGQIMLFLNGILLVNTVGYTISGTTITMQAGYIPIVGDYLRVTYQY